MIEIIGPAGFEHFFWGVTELASAGPPDPESIAALAAEYGLVFGDAPWLEDVIARYGLTPPPGRRRAGSHQKGEVRPVACRVRGRGCQPLDVNPTRANGFLQGHTPGPRARQVGCRRATCSRLDTGPTALAAA